MRLVLLLVLTGCWSTPRPTGPSAVLERKHVAGDVLRVCTRGDGTVTSPELKAPITVTTRNIYDEHVLAAQPHRFELRSDTVSASSRMVVPGHEPVAIAVPKRQGNQLAVDERNRRLDLAFEPTKTPIDDDRINLSFLPYVSDFTDLAYPDAALRKHATFPLRVRRSIDHTDARPSQLAIDATFTVREVTAQYVELACKGTHVESVERGDQRAAVSLDFTCRVRMNRRDGRTARWWLDATGTTQTTPDAKSQMRVQAHYDIAIGDIDSAVCDAAREPS